MERDVSSPDVRRNSAPSRASFPRDEKNPNNLTDLQTDYFSKNSMTAEHRQRVVEGTGR